MLALKIVLGILLFLLLLLLLPLRVHAAFDGELRMRVGYGPVLITVYPAKENKKKPPPITARAVPWIIRLCPSSKVLFVSKRTISGSRLIF